MTAVSKARSCDIDLLSKNLEVLRSAFNSGTFTLEIDHSQTTVIDPKHKVQDIFWGFYGEIFYTASQRLENKRNTFASIRSQLHAAVSVLQEKDREFRCAIAAPGTSYSKAQNAIETICSQLFFFSADSTASIQRELYPIVEMFKKYEVSEPLVSTEQVAFLERVSIDYAMTAVLSRTGKAYPVAAFRKILQIVKYSPDEKQKNETLTLEERQNLTAWIQSVQRPNAYISPGTLHKAMLGCVSIIDDTPDPYSSAVQEKLSQIGWYLVSMKEAPLTMLLQNDKDHLTWILATGCTKVTSDGSGSTPTLGKYVVYSSIQQENFSLYENDAQTYVLTANNRFRLGLWDTVCRFQSWSVEPLERKFKDSQGKFYVIEKVDYNLADYVYKSQNEIHPDDMPLLQELAALLNFWARHTKIPKKLALDTLFVKTLEDKSLIIKAFIPIEWQDTVAHDFSRLESFAWQFAKENVAVFTYLMQRSRLCSHSVATILYSIYHRKLTSSDRVPLGIKEELGMEQITDLLLAERAEKVVKKLKAAQNTIYLHTLSRRQIASLNEQENRMKQIATQLVEFQRKACFCTRIHPKLSDFATIQDLANRAI